MSATASAPLVPLGTCPAELTGAIRSQVRRCLDWECTVGNVVTVLRPRLPSPADLLPGRLLAGDPAGYQSHLLHAEPDGSFSVSVMVWLPGQETVIHDHVAWCCTAVLAGQENEEIFALAGDEDALRLVGRAVNPAGSVAGFTPPGDIHRVRNAGDGVAVSMHVYGADISRLGNSIRRDYRLPILPGPVA